MTQDLIEAALLAVITAVFLGPLWSLVIGAGWILAARRLRSRGLDSDWEHTGHRRHKGRYLD